MSLEHLDLLHDELPELFQDRELPHGWDEPYLILPFDPEDQGGDPLALPDESLTGQGLWSDDMPNNPSSFGNERMPAQILDLLGLGHPGSPLRIEEIREPLPPDCLAFYLPFHYYHPVWWGVYLWGPGVNYLARQIQARSPQPVGDALAWRAAKLFLYHHEAFHHQAECFATRLELTHRRPFYKTGFERLYQTTLGTDACLEEGLANARALDKTWQALRDRDVDQALESYVRDSLPGYRMGQRFRSTYLDTRCRFAEDNQHICLPHLPTKHPNVWRAAPLMFDGIANIRSRVNYILPEHSPLAKRLRFRPMLSPSRLVKRLKAQVGLTFERSGGKHDIYRTAHGQLVAIPRHPRDLAIGTLHKILREVGWTLGVQAFLEEPHMIPGLAGD